MDNFKTQKPITILLATILLVNLSIFGQMAQATHVTPNLVSGNPSCPSGLTSFKLDDLSDYGGTFSDGFLTVTVTPTAPEKSPFSWTSNLSVQQVIAKGGPNANVYNYGDPGDTIDTGLVTPTNPSNGKLYDISHIDFCYERPIIPPAFTLTIIKNLVEGSDDEEFSFTVTGPSSPGTQTITTVGGTGFTSIPDLTPGTWSVTEDTTPTGYVQVSADCELNAVPQGTTTDILTANGDNLVCIFENRQNPTIEIEKNILNGEDDEFCFEVIAGGDSDNDYAPCITTVLGSGSDGPTSVNPDSYTITETELEEWNLASVNCELNGELIIGDFPIELAAGDELVCTFENELKGKIIIEKVTIPTGGEDFEFVPDFDENFFLDDGDSEEFTVTAGTYLIEELESETHVLTSIVCNDDDSSGDVDTSTATINVDSGETVTCTFTNTEKGKIIIAKETIPGGGEGFEFESNIDENFFLDDGNSEELSVVPGTYSVTELESETHDLTAISCDNDESSGDVDTSTATITVAAGETVTCTFTNTEKGKIIIVKETDPEGGTGFGFTSELGDFVLDDGNSEEFVVSSGAYSVTEESTSGYRLISITCDDDDSTGDTESRTASINVAPGEEVTCTFVNKEIKPTRTQGFWSNQVRIVNQVLGVTGTDACFGTSINAANCDIPSPLILGGATSGKVIDDLPTYYAGFEAGISKNSNGSVRSALNQAKMVLTQQALAAMMNCRMGSSPGFDTFASKPFLDASCNATLGTSTGDAINVSTSSAAAIAEINRVKTALDAFNNSEDSAPLPGSISAPLGALPDVKKKTANSVYADSGESPAGLSGIVGYNDLYWTGGTQPRDI